MSAPRPRSPLRDLPPYVGGRETVEGIADPYKLSANENPLGASPAAMAALADLPSPAIYPDGGARALRDKLASLNAIDAERIICGNGSDDILQLLAQAYLAPGDNVLHSAHGFLIYKLTSRAAGAETKAVPEKDLTADVDALLASVDAATKIVFLANPNNPTGTMLDRAAIERLHAGLREDIILVLDGAYAEYVDPDFYPHGFDLVDANANVVTTRTFSKAYGLAGLRLGWGYCPADIADVLNRLRAPFNVNQAAIYAGLAALDDQAHIAASRAHNTQWRDWLCQQIGGLGLGVRGGQANFVLIEFTTPAQASAAEAFMCAKGVIPRGLAAYDLPHALRLSVGTEAGNRAAIDALTDFLAASKTDGTGA